MQRLQTVTFERHDQDNRDPIQGPNLDNGQKRLPANVLPYDLFHPREKRNPLDGLIALLQTASSQV